MTARRRTRIAGIALAAAGWIVAAKAGDGIARPARSGTAAALTDRRGMLTCEAAIGRPGAERLRDLCIGVSPATRPPCGTRNSCALIKDEIARSCAVIGDRDAAKTPACKSPPSSAAAAVDVLRRFYEAIDAHDYATAFDMIRPSGGEGRTFKAFRSGYAATRSTRVTPGKPGEVEGAAGSVYVMVPVTVEATLTNGERQRFGGSYVLRRVDGGNTPPSDDQRWHIFSAHLDPERGDVAR